MLLLRNRFSLTLAPRAPFNFDASVHKPSHYPDSLEVYAKGSYWTTIRAGARVFGVKLENLGTTGKPKVKATFFFNGSISNNEKRELVSELDYRYELDRDLSEFNTAFASDKRFGPFLKRWKGMRNSCAHGLYELLIIGVTLQNATVRRSVQMLNALLAHYGRRVSFGGKEAYAFWKPRDMLSVPEAELRTLKLGYRAKTIKRLSETFVRENIDEKKLRTLSKEQAREQLTALYGVGPETARILLFEALHHYDTFDHIAPWQQKIYSKLFYNKKIVPADKIKADILKKYGKYSMLAVHYIWEDVFWRRKHERIGWLEKEIRL
jgi:3-methyladenine DNA glycosylase/8-oxoguanine DNA glycosylase